MAGRTDPIASRLAVERASLGPLPTHAPDLGLLAEVLAHSTGRVRFQTNDYSVPIQYAYQRVTLKADPFRVRVFAGEELVADHPRGSRKASGDRGLAPLRPAAAEKAVCGSLGLGFAPRGSASDL